MIPFAGPFGRDTPAPAPATLLLAWFLCCDAATRLCWEAGGLLVVAVVVTGLWLRFLLKYCAYFKTLTVWGIHANSPNIKFGALPSHAPLEHICWPQENAQRAQICPCSEKQLLSYHQLTLDLMSPEKAKEFRVAKKYTMSVCDIQS